MVTITYSGTSKPGAMMLASEGNYRLNRGSIGDVNWGRRRADTLLNPDISNSVNKWHMRRLFQRYDVPMPKLVDSLDEHITYPILGRKTFHTRKKGFYVCNSYDDVEKALQKGASHFMEYVRGDNIKEFRCHIFRGKSIRLSEKLFDEELSDYVTIKPTLNKKPMREAAKKAVGALGLDFGAVDILADGESVWVLEVNAAPGLGGSTPRVYTEAINKYLEERFA